MRPCQAALCYAPAKWWVVWYVPIEAGILQHTRQLKQRNAICEGHRIAIEHLANEMQEPLIMWPLWRYSS
jgi:hypothetical protein